MHIDFEKAGREAKERIARQDFYKRNLEGYCCHHPGEAVAIRGASESGFTEEFYPTRHEAIKSVGKSANILVERVPLEMMLKAKAGEITHSYNYNPNDIDGITLDHYIECCPNDGKTKLKSRIGIHKHTDKKGKPYYVAFFECPVCDCKVQGVPSDRDIRKYEAEMRKNDKLIRKSGEILVGARAA